MAEDATARDVIQRADRMEAKASNFRNHWQEVKTFLQPVMADITRMTTPGTKNRAQILTNRGENASELLAGALHAMLAMPETKWFELRPENEALLDDDETNDWLDRSRDRMLTAFDSPRTQFGENIGELFRNTPDFGTGFMYIEERAGDLPLYQNRPIGELLAEEGPDGKIDTVYRRFKFTARQAKAFFEAAGASPGPKVAEAADKPTKADDEFDYIHAVFPRETRDRTSRDEGNMPIASLWVSETDKLTIRESGFPEFPYAVPRWWRTPGETYGRGPGMKALADVKMMQRVMRATIRGAEKTIDPNLLVADDGVLGPIRTMISGITRVRAELLSGRNLGPVRPMQSGARPDLGIELVLFILEAIEQAYYNHLLRLSRDPRMTATQSLLLDEESLRILGPFLLRLQNEGLESIVDRTFAILLRQGFFGPPPPQLIGQRIKVDYVSPQVKQQRLGEARAVLQFEELTQPMVARDPTIADNFDGDEAYRFVADRVGLPPHLLRLESLVDRMRAARQDVAEETQAKRDFVELAPAAQSAAQAVQGLTGGADG